MDEKKKQEIKAFLELVAPKVVEQNDARKQQMADGKGFNIFFSTGIQNKEVCICRLLQDLLSPEGTHGLGVLFLASFNKTVLRGLMHPSEVNTAKVYREDRTDENRRIDLTIETDKRYIPIEVKIFASDQHRQCVDYYEEKERKRKNYGKSEPTVLYYLTTDGHFPTANSMGSLLDGTNLKTISFYKDIITWVKDCLNEPMVKKSLYVKYTLLQFADVIERWRFPLENRDAKGIFDFIKGLSSQEQECAFMVWKSINTARLGREQDFLNLVDKHIKKYINVSVEDKEHYSGYRYSDNGSGIYIELTPNAKKTKLTFKRIVNEKIENTPFDEEELDFGKEHFSETIFIPAQLDAYVQICVKKIEERLPKDAPVSVEIVKNLPFCKEK